MPRKKLVITGQVPKAEPTVEKDLVELMGEKRQSKFGKYPTREEYRKFLYSLGHIEICEELMRLGSYPSTSKTSCVERCMAAYDRAKLPRKNQPEHFPQRELQDIIRRDA